MEAKDKAKELVDRFYNSEYCHKEHFPNKNYCECVEISKFQAKQCALICVKEMLCIYDNEGYDGEDSEMAYLEEVKQEIIIYKL
jgi:hypothetical protein